MNNKYFYSFPHNINGDNIDIYKAITKLTEDAKTFNHPCILKNITLQEKQFAEKFFPDAKSEETRQSCDYLYFAEKLSKLAGKTYSKKRNHINQFAKAYADFTFKLLDSDSANYIYLIEEKWLSENTGLDFSNNNDDLIYEKQIIKSAIDNFEFFQKHCGMQGGILFAENEPVAFCIASILCSEVCDIHFEKCLSQYARNGGYAVINQEFAKTVTTKFINREEDLGIEGLRKAKLSYYPQIILEKFDIQIA